MDTFEALLLIEALARGVDPRTSQPVPTDSPLHHPEVIRALFIAIRLIESKFDKKGSAKLKKSCPKRAGEPWKEDEDQ